MTDPKSTEDQSPEEKEGVSLADIVRVLVLGWSATLLTVSYLNVVPGMKMDSTFVASLLTGAMAGFGIEREGNGQQKRRLLQFKATTPLLEKMKRLALVFGITLMAAPVQADIIHRIQSSVSLSVDGAGSVADRIGSTVRFLVTTSLWTLLVVSAPLLPEALLVTLLLLTLSLLVVTRSALPNPSSKETQRRQQLPSPPES